MTDTVCQPANMAAELAGSRAVAPGGEIIAYGAKYSWRRFSCSPPTNGCIGLWNIAMDVVRYATSAGMPISIRP
ncbi:hypothetical protein ACFPL7_01155 [Dongia soli]|uniref:Uncharacterized protein n=1 Tax=Dongia soli TaxID=600628 RepID=A0ABU5EFI6_9PROT|nr:hypothetical protein [Dongia soli]MDY0884285.1 hypothetical protein [Dongia soli]